MLDIKVRDNTIPVKEEAPALPVEEAVTNPVESALVVEKDHAKTTEQRKTKQKKIQKLITILLGVAVFFMLTTAYAFYEVYVLKKLAAAEALLNPEVPVTPDQILDAVAHHLILPTGTPQIATVQDAKKLSTSQAFFKDATNGDVVLVYDSMIILYRPTKDIIVAVGDISGVTK
jgi:hypothetical protein